MNLDSCSVEASLVASFAGLDEKSAQRKGAKVAEELLSKPLRPWRLCVQFFAFSCREIASKLAPKSNVFLEMNP